MDIKNNIANALTIARMVMLPVMVGLFYMEDYYGDTAIWACFGLYVAASITDYLDGYLARKLNQTSDFGTFLDPISDKIMVGIILVMLVATERIGSFGVILTILIFSREFMVSGLREYMGPKGIKVPVTKLAKWKTTVQMLACGILILSGKLAFAYELGITLLLLATLLTLITGWGYIKTTFLSLKKNPLVFAFAFIACLLFGNNATLAQDHPDYQNTPEMHAMALHGEPKYGKDFEHLEYVNPNAPKGGTIKIHSTGTFDSLNPFIVKGVAGAGLNYLRSGLFYESLMQNAWDEPFSLYGVIAKSIYVAEDKSWVKFTLRDEARWHDGVPISASDVVWTFKTLVKEGTPFFKAYWHDVKSVEALDDKTVLFKFNVSGNAELPLIVAEMTVLPEHYWSKPENDFTKTSLKIPPGSGPYRIAEVIAGRKIKYVRDENWWGKDLPLFKGMNNFDEIIYDYYRDENVAHEAFLARHFDVKIENVGKIWYEGYKLPADKSKQLVKEDIHNSRPAGMQAFIYNIRRPIFKDKALRAALAYALDFEWSNKQFAYGDYVRSNSYFENSRLSSCCKLPDAAELEILEPLRGKIPDEVFTKTYKAPISTGSGNDRRLLRKGIGLLEKAGYTKLDENGVRYKILDDGSVQTLEFEILHYSSTFERWVLPFIKNLKRMGVKASFRVVDSAQFQQRTAGFDFDMLIGGFGQSGSPGNEQREFWGSDKANMHGSRNLIGINDRVIDELVTGIIHAKSRDELVTRTRALDRVLLWNHYVIPMWHYPKWRIAYWDNIKRPEQLSGISPMITQTWWSNEIGDKDAHK